MLSEKRAAQEGKKEYQPKKYQKGGHVTKDSDIPLPFLNKGETGPQSPSVFPKKVDIPSTVPPDLSVPDEPQLLPQYSEPVYGAKKGGPVTKVSEGRATWRRW